MKNLTLLLTCLILISGCKKDDPAPDPRLKAPGSYAYIGKFYEYVGGDLQYLGIASDLTGDFTVTVDASDPTIMNITDAADTKKIFKCTNATVISGGFSFEIPKQDVTDSNNKAVTLTGFSNAYLGNNGPYQGAYETKSGLLTFYFQYLLSGRTFIGEFTCAQR
jgi:hypothetical protein